MHFTTNAANNQEIRQQKKDYLSINDQTHVCNIKEGIRKDAFLNRSLNHTFHDLCYVHLKTNFISFTIHTQDIDSSR